MGCSSPPLSAANVTFTFPRHHSGMTTAATISPTPPQGLNNNTDWWTGEQVRNHLAHCQDPEAALIKLGHDVAAGRAQAKVSSACDPRSGGRPQVFPQPPKVDGDIWWRISALAPEIDIWTAPTLSLPRTGNEKAVDLIGLRFLANDVRRVADEHGYHPPAKLKPKSQGGIPTRAHGLVVAKVTLDLLARGPIHVLGLTPKNLEKEVARLYRSHDRRGVCDENAGRIAGGILEVVQQHFSEGSVHSVHD